ncbi:MAG: tetratricopeptide repeat protein [Gemmatimonadaceae bacterium]|nr:tetratricopeptide repeat protein [Gemmatimonadaceae bacterium]
MSLSRLALVLALAPAPLVAQQETTALRKSDLVRYLTGTTYSKPEIAAIVRRSCLAFVPSERDREDLRALGATPRIFREIDACVRSGNKPGAERAASAAAPSSPPHPATLRIVDPTPTAVSGGVAYITVEARRGNAPERGKRLTLQGATEIRDGAHSAPVAVTDERGRATFTVPAGTRAGTYTLTVVAADGSPLAGSRPFILTTVAAAPSAATVSPTRIEVGPGTPTRRDVTVTVTDPFGNLVSGQAVRLEPPAGRAGLAAQTQQTSDVGTARFTVPVESLRAGDSLVVMVGTRRYAAISVTPSAEVTAQMLEAERRLAQQRPGAEAAYDSVLAVDPANAYALIGRGYVRSWQRKYDLAQQDFEAALRSDSARSDAYTGLGYTAARRGDYATAVAQFQRALRIAPDQPAAATGLALAELWQHDPRQAAVRAEALSNPRPTAYPAAAAAHFRTGVQQLVRRDAPAAARSFSAAITASGAWPEAYYNRALAYDAAGQLSAAAADYERYLQLRPNAANRDVVLRRLDALGRSPGRAFVRGLMFPGLGQFYTRQIALGTITLVGVGASTAWALGQHKVVETRTFTDTFGAKYTSQVTVNKRSNLTAGLAIAGGVWLASAIEAAVHAGNRGEVPLPSAAGGTDAPRSTSRLELAPLVRVEPAGPAFGAAVRVPFR